METYTGPLKAGMLMENRASGHREALTNGDIESCERAWREKWRPVRPSDSDASAWALFVPDGPLPDAGAQALRAGEVRAYWNPNTTTRGVFVIVDDSNRATIKVRWLDSDSNRGHFSPVGAINHSVVIFPAVSAPEPAPSPQERVLAPGWSTWEPHPGCNPCLVAGKPDWRNVGGFAKGFPGERVGHCLPCAEAAGAFAPVHPTVTEAARAYRAKVDECQQRSDELRASLLTLGPPARCACNHAAHTGICPGSSAFGHEACPCPMGRVATVPRHRRPIVGTYGGKGTIHDWDARNAMATSDREQASPTLLANLARETPAAPEPLTKGRFLTARIGGGR